MAHTWQVAGGGTAVEVDPQRLVGWINRFAARNGGIATLTSTLSAVTATAGNHTVATIAVPYPPMAPSGAEPVEALLTHLRGIGPIALVLVRAAAFSIGVCEDQRVVVSSTDTRYVQGRTAAGGWSQQRYARRRSNQLRDSHRAAADAAARVLAPQAGRLRALVLGGEKGATREVLADPRLGSLLELPRRTFADVGEPRRAVLDELAERTLAVEIVIRPHGSRRHAVIRPGWWRPTVARSDCPTAPADAGGLVADRAGRPRSGCRSGSGTSGRGGRTWSPRRRRPG
jgi:hypothetical protein